MTTPRKRTKPKGEQSKITEGAVPADELKQEFPPINLPIRPPYPPMEAKLVDEIPRGDNWQYEPKWDGFRCLAFRKGDQVLLQSKAGQPLGRYFPEVVEALLELKPAQFVLDGEIVILHDDVLSFDDLLMRIHPAASRIQRLSKETPATYLLFDLLVDDKGKAIVDRPLSERRERLERLHKSFGKRESIRLSPATRDYAKAQRWMSELAASGFDGVVAKELDCQYASGERTAMRKIKRIRTADCVVGGFRYASKGGEVGSLLLGLYDEDGKLNHVGFSSSFAAPERKKLKALLKPYMGGAGFTGHAPGGPSRWSTERSGDWEPLKPKLVCEVRYDHFSGDRFRHGTKFLRWRPEKNPKSCTYEQVKEKAVSCQPSAISPQLRQMALSPANHRLKNASEIVRLARVSNIARTGAPGCRNGFESQSGGTAFSNCNWGDAKLTDSRPTLRWPPGCGSKPHTSPTHTKSPLGRRSGSNRRLRRPARRTTCDRQPAGECIRTRSRANRGTSSSTPQWRSIRDRQRRTVHDSAPPPT